MKKAQVTATEMRIFDEKTIGFNPHYMFRVARLDAPDGPWIGYARARGAYFLFPEIGADGRLGLESRQEAILRTGAIAEDPGAGFGGIDVWCVGAAERGDPDHYRCPDCGELFCEEH